MANEVKWKAPTNRATGISSGSLNAGANLLSNEIDNQTNLNRFLALELLWTCSTASNAGEVVEVYILTALDGTNYEDGGTTVDSYKAPVGTFVDDGGTGAQRQAMAGIPIPPFKFKVLIRSELSQNATSVDLDAETYDEDIQ